MRPDEWPSCSALIGNQAAIFDHLLAAELDLSVLVVERADENVLWAWLGSRRRPDPNAAMRRAESVWPEESPLAIGEPGEGLAGWRRPTDPCASSTSRRWPVSVTEGLP